MYFLKSQPTFDAVPNLLPQDPQGWALVQQTGEQDLPLRDHWQLHFHLHHFRGADKSLAQPGRKQARKQVRDVRDFNNIETQAVKSFFFLQGKVPKEIHAILIEILACFISGGGKDLSAPL